MSPTANSTHSPMSGAVGERMYANVVFFDGPRSPEQIAAADHATAQRLVMSTELLPGQDPALLPGPDRVETYDVVFAHTPDVTAGAAR